MPSFINMRAWIGQAYTLGNIRHRLWAMFGPESRDVHSMMLIGAPEFIIAAALARLQVGE